MADAVRFCEAAGFDVERYDDGFAFVHLDDQSVFDLDLMPTWIPRRTTPVVTSSPTTSTTGTPASSTAGLQVTPIEDMPWGMHEFTLTDPSGNNIRVGRNVSDD